MILYKGDYRIIDLQEWHTWWPWVPVQLTDLWLEGKGPWRWLYEIERRIDYERTFDKVKIEEHKFERGHQYEYIWEYRDIGVRNAIYSS